MIHHLRFVTFLFVVTIIANSCEKDSFTGSHEADILSYTVIDTKTEGLIGRTDKTIVLNFPTGLQSALDFTAEFTISEGATATIRSSVQESGKSLNNYEVPFTLQIIAEDQISVTHWLVKGINNDYTVDWGLGGFLKESLSFEREYAWYFDQGDTKKYKYDNCGPTATTMAAKWSDSTFSQTPDDARAAYRPDGGWWYTDDISNYFTDYGIPHSIIELGNSTSKTENRIKAGLENGKLVLLCLDMYYISSNSTSEEKVDKFYYTQTSDWGHFILVKGFKVVDGTLFFEVYDPYSLGEKYYDGNLKGKDRYYRSNDIFAATKIWWNYAFYISEKSNAVQNLRNSADHSGIIHQWGR